MMFATLKPLSFAFNVAGYHYALNILQKFPCCSLLKSKLYRFIFLSKNRVQI